MADYAAAGNAIREALEDARKVRKNHRDATNDAGSDAVLLGHLSTAERQMDRMIDSLKRARAVAEREGLVVQRDAVIAEIARLDAILSAP